MVILYFAEQIQNKNKSGTDKLSTRVNTVAIPAARGRLCKPTHKDWPQKMQFAAAGRPKAAQSEIGST